MGEDVREVSPLELSFLEEGVAFSQRFFFPWQMDFVL